nr:small RNA-binding protein 11, chloroplastic [Ipomoea batatas]
MCGSRGSALPFAAYLPYTTDENCLLKEFSKFGQIAEVKIAKDKGSKTSRGYAFIQYTSQEHAMLALEHMDSKV